MSRIAARQIIIILLLLICNTTVFAQPGNFTLTLTKTDETCTGNGKITFQIDNGTPAATMLFAVYAIPNVTTPIATTSALFIDGLSAGNYRVVATQTLGGQSNSQQQDITINHFVVPLTYYLSGSNICNNGSIAVQVAQGTAVGYEIIAGPVIRPQQTVSVFNNLPVGEYTIRVYDACGDAVVQTFTLVSPPKTFALDALQPKQCALVNCTTILLAHDLTATLGTISYPVTIQYTVHPPSGAATVFSQVVASGDPLGQEFEMALPFYNQSYTVDVVITDNCGYVTTSNGNLIDAGFTASVSSSPQLCVRNLSIDVCNFVAPVTVSFISAPPGFNPSDFNAQHPGGFSSLPISYIGQTTEMPVGNYTVQLTDACGRTAQAATQLGEDPEPGYSMLPQSCGFGQVSIPGPTGPRVNSVIITSAPAAFNQALPYNASAMIVDGFFQMAQLPAGTYTFVVVSVCGQTYTYSVTIPTSGSQPVLIGYFRGCELGFTSVRLGVQGSALTQVILNAAPAGFGQSLPFDATANIDPVDGQFYMNGLVQGIYTLFLKDECGQRTITIEMPGYDVLTDTVAVDPNCGSFNILLNYTTNEPFSPHTFWLQKYDPVTAQWTHPITNFAATNNSDPTPLTAAALLNQTNNINIVSIGTFRVLKLSKIYANGQSVPVSCLTTLKEFVFTGGPQILDANLLPCASNPGQVAIVAAGMAPLSYYITAKDGQPFYVSNGASNVFTGLAPGIYNFQVRDVCQNIVNRLFDFGSIPPPAVVQSILCDGQTGTLSIDGFDFLNFQWWNAAQPNLILSTSSTLAFTPFNAAVHAGTYVVRIYSTQTGFCTDQTVTYTIPPAGQSPFAGNDGTVSLCGQSGTVDLFDYLGGGFQTGGVWEELTGSGTLVGHNWLPQGVAYGNYRFRYTVTGLCSQTDWAEVVAEFNPIPATPTVTPPAPVCASGSISLTAGSIAGANYVWTGPNGFVSNAQNPVIENANILNSGTYEVRAQIANCASPAALVTVTVNPSPEFTVVAGCNGNAYQVTVIPTSGQLDPDTVLEWTGPDGFSAGGNPLVLTGGVSGIYTLKLMSAECEIIRDVDVAGTPCAFPTGISPNNDGNNERFDLTGFGVQTFKIYNRYGRMVYEQENYKNQWYGQDFNDNLLPDATYYYYVKQQSGAERTGWVYLTR